MDKSELGSMLCMIIYIHGVLPAMQNGDVIWCQQAVHPHGVIIVWIVLQEGDH